MIALHAAQQLAQRVALHRCLRHTQQARAQRRGQHQPVRCGGGEGGGRGAWDALKRGWRNAPVGTAALVAWTAVPVTKPPPREHMAWRRCAAQQAALTCVAHGAERARHQARDAASKRGRQAGQPAAAGKRRKGSWPWLARRQAEKQSTGAPQRAATWRAGQPPGCSGAHLGMLRPLPGAAPASWPSAPPSSRMNSFISGGSSMPPSSSCEAAGRWAGALMPSGRAAGVEQATSALIS